MVVSIALASVLLAGCAAAPTRGGTGLAVAAGKVYVGSADGRIYAISPASRKEGVDFPSSGEWFFPPDTELGPLYAAPYIEGETVYLAAMFGQGGGFFLGSPRLSAYVYFLDAATGQKRRDAIPLETSELAIGSPASDRETLFVAAGKHIFAIGKATGKPRWQRPFEAEGKIWSDLVVSENTLYFGSLDHKVYALNTLTGEQRWPPFVAEGAVAATPLIANGIVYIGSFDGNLYAIDAASGKAVWPRPFQGGGWFWGKAVEREGKVYAANLDGKVHAVDARSGQPVWAQPFVAPAAIRSSPAMVDGTLVVASVDGHVYGLDADTGRERWTAPYILGNEVVADLTAFGNAVYIRAKDNAIHVLAADTGGLLWKPFPLKVPSKK